MVLGVSSLESHPRSGVERLASGDSRDEMRLDLHIHFSNLNHLKRCVNSHAWDWWEVVIRSLHLYVLVNTLSYTVSPSCFHIIFFLMFIFEREKEWERDRVQAGEGQRENGRHRIWNRLQALSCQHRAQGGAWIHEPRDHDLSWSQMLNWLSHPGA